MIDSHCHLNREPLLSNLNQVLIRAKNAGIEKLLTICTTTTEYTDILDIISKDQMIYGTFGVHPHETRNYFIEKIYKMGNHSGDRLLHGNDPSWSSTGLRTGLIVTTPKKPTYFEK